MTKLYFHSLPTIFFAIISHDILATPFFVNTSLVSYNEYIRKSFDHFAILSYDSTSDVAGSLLNIPSPINLFTLAQFTLFHFPNIIVAVMLFIAMIGLYLCSIKIRRLKHELNDISSEQKLLIANFEITIKDLEDSKEELYQHNLFIKKLATIIVHDLQSPFRFLISGSETLTKKISRRSGYDELEVLSSEIENSGRKTLQFITEFGLWLKSIDKEYSARMESVNIYHLLTELNTFLSEILAAKANVLQLEIDSNLSLVTDKELLRVILRNIVDNANKHSFNNKIVVSYEKNNDYCNLIIQDYGSGISTPDLKQIRSTISENSHQLNYFNSDGQQGYKLIGHFSKLLNIGIKVDSEYGKNTAVTLTNISCLN